MPKNTKWKERKIENNLFTIHNTKQTESIEEKKWKSENKYRNTY